MTKNIVSIPSDLQMRCLLRAHDPAMGLSEDFLQDLRGDILARTREVEQITSMPEALVFGSGFSRVAAFAATLVLVLGFGVGQTFYQETSSSYSGRLSLIALADDASQSVMGSSWGGDSDDFE